uniref:Peptidase S74 domain-containing protein n=1 Tax=viral metagenome TaxID=1070528 RepID=A0A6C0KWS0_9ZZZZ
MVGDVSMESSLDISKNLHVHTNLLVAEDVSFGSHLQVVGDVSMESSLEISNNMIVHTNLLVDGDVSFGSHLHVVGDVSMESSLEISNNLFVHTNLLVDGDASFGTHLQVSGDLSVASDLSVGGSGTFNGESFFKNNVNFGTNTSDVSLVLYGDFKIKAGGNLVIEDSSFSITEIHTDVKITDILDISNHGTGPALMVRQYDTSAQDIARFMDGITEVFVIGNDGKTDIAGDVGLSSSLDVSLNVSVHSELFVDKDVSFGENLTVVGDVTFESSLDISGTLTTSEQFVLKTDSTERMVIDSSGIQFVNSDPSYTAVDISSTSALGLPVGTSDERPIDEKKGHIRYNDQLNQFEGYGDGGWQGLGGVIDNDQDTKITTDSSNNLIFDTSGSTQMVIDSDGDVSMANNLNVVGGLTVDGSLDVRSNALYIDSSTGRVGVGTSVPGNKFHVAGWGQIRKLGLNMAPNNDYELRVDGDVYTSGGIGVGKEKDSEYELDVSGDIHCTGTLFADSDIKVKKNLVPLDKSLDKLTNLNGYYYHKVGEEEDSLKHIGVIAQEVEAEYPELVSKNADIKSVNYDGINAILIECVKELRKENLAFKSELEELKNKVEKM